MLALVGEPRTEDDHLSPRLDHVGDVLDELAQLLRVLGVLEHVESEDRVELGGVREGVLDVVLQVFGDYGGGVGGGRRLLLGVLEHVRGQIDTDDLARGQVVSDSASIETCTACNIKNRSILWNQIDLRLHSWLFAVQSKITVFFISLVDLSQSLVSVNFLRTFHFFFIYSFY